MVVKARVTPLRLAPSVPASAASTLNRRRKRHTRTTIEPPENHSKDQNKNSGGDYADGRGLEIREPLGAEVDATEHGGKIEHPAPVRPRALRGLSRTGQQPKPQR